MHIMKIDADSYFLRHFVNNGAEYASFSHYGEVWDNGYTVDTYLIYDGNIYFEDASWNGVSPTIKDHKSIMARQFNRWVKDIEMTKELVINMGRNARLSFVSEFKAGDYLFCRIPQYEYNDSYWHCFLEVISVDTDCVKARMITINKHSFGYSNKIDDITFEEDYWLDVALKTGNIFLTERTVFNRAVNLIQQLTSKIISEAKNEFDK